MSRRSGDPWGPEIPGSFVLRASLAGARLFGPVLRRCRIDERVFRTVLELRLIHDLKGGRPSARRRGPSVGAVLAILFFFFAGFGAGLLSLFRSQPAFFAGLGSAVFLLLLVFVFALQFATIFVDPTDLEVIAPLPVDSRTLFAARIAHALTYLVVLGAAFGLPSTILASIGSRSIVPLAAWPLCIACAMLATLGTVALAHALLLAVMGPERFQRATFWMQIGFMTFLIGGFQTLQAVIPVGRIVSAVRERDAWLALFPPTHYAGLYSLLMGRDDPWNRTMALLALLVPPLALVATLLLASRDFARALAGGFTRHEALDRRGSVELVEPHRVARAWLRRGLVGVERAGFGISWALSARDRMYLRATLPALAATALPLFAVSITLRRADVGIAEFVPILASYVLALSVPTAAEALRITEDGRSAWLLHALPLERPGEYVRGAVKAAVARWVIPLAVLLLFLQLAFLGPAALYDVPLALGTASLIGIHAVRVMTIGLPFTHKPSPNDFDVTNLHVVLGLMVWALAAAAMHVAMWYWLPGWIRCALGIVPWCFVPAALRGWSELRTRPLPVLRP